MIQVKYPCSKECISYAICNSRLKDSIRNTLKDKTVSGNYATTLAINIVLAKCSIFFQYIADIDQEYGYDKVERNMHIVGQTIHYYNISYLQLS